MKKSGGIAAISTNVVKIKMEAERLEVMDKAAGILGELLFTEQLLGEVKQYRQIIVPVSTCSLWCCVVWLYYRDRAVCRGKS